MNSQIEQAIEQRDNYLDFLAALPASIYNNNSEIFQANLERMNQEIDRMIEEADDLRVRNAMLLAWRRLSTAHHPPHGGMRKKKGVYKQRYY